MASAYGSQDAGGVWRRTRAQRSRGPAQSPTIPDTRARRRAVRGAPRSGLRGSVIDVNVIITFTTFSRAHV